MAHGVPAVDGAALIEGLAWAVLVFVGVMHALELNRIFRGREASVLGLSDQGTSAPRRELEEILGTLMAQLPEEHRRRLFELVERV